MSNPRIPFRLAGSEPALAPPGGKSLIVHLVVNIEHWPFDRAMPRQVIPAPHGRAPVPDVPNFAWAEYGLRTGIRRLIEILAQHGVPASVSINAGVIEAYPACAEAVRDAGWEFIAHGVQQRSLQDEDDERAAIALSLERIESFTGTRPRGWLGPGLIETFETPDHLKEAGLDYVCDWVLDDLPAWMTTRHGPLIALPYTLELNDSVIYAVEKHESAEIYRRLIDTLATFEPELAREPRVLTIALHPHLIGVPHRMVHLARMLDLLGKRGDAAFMTGSGIADWFAASRPAPGG